MREINSKDNKLIKYISRLNSSSSFRKKEGCFVCEGVRLCADALRSGIKIKAAFFTTFALERHSELVDSLDKSVECYSLADSLFKSVCETQTPQGVMFLCQMLEVGERSLAFNKAVALECVQDPQNMGTILRSAEAFAIDCVILSKDCCDIFSPKVLRGSMGAVFRQKFYIAEDFYLTLTTLNNNGIKTYAAVPRNGIEILSADFSTPCCTLIGNEGNGLTQKAIDLCDSRLTINMKGNAESLNAAVAASVVMWEMVRGNLNE
ncbi:MULTISPECIES: RNA methyltransferase [unclassified Ruminococcus]|uniref:TrmH family RNA methyltransferase n=1 Tax=unclassified Ruminococcus TaxID=2608920 RepID=UPI00210C49BC